jgi:predicted molibdopterin-dependent oxidoreductase YjgC
VDPPGEARPAGWIFSKLAGRMGLKWNSSESRDVWEREMSKEIPAFRNVTYDSLIPDGQKLKPDLKSFRGKRIKISAGFGMTDHHRILVEHCRDLHDLVRKRFREGE